MTKFNLYIGADFEKSFVCKDSTGTVVNLTGYTPTARVRSALSDADAILDLSPTIPTPANGIIVVDVPAATTATLTAGSYKWDLTLETPDGSVIYIEGGTIQFRQLASREDEAP